MFGNFIRNSVNKDLTSPMTRLRDIKKAHKEQEFYEKYKAQAIASPSISDDIISKKSYESGSDELEI